MNDSQNSSPSSHYNDRTGMILKRPRTSRVQQIFLGHCYTCHNFGHMVRECKLRKNSSIKFQKQRKGWKRMEVVTQKMQRSLKSEGSFYDYGHYCHKFGHKAIGCRIKIKDLSKESEKQTRLISMVPHGKMCRRKKESKGEEEKKISNIKEVSQDDVKHNSVVDKNKHPL